MQRSFWQSEILPYLTSSYSFFSDQSLNPPLGHFPCFLVVAVAVQDDFISLLVFFCYIPLGAPFTSIFHLLSKQMTSILITLLFFWSLAPDFQCNTIHTKLFSPHSITGKFFLPISLLLVTLWPYIPMSRLQDLH